MTRFTIEIEALPDAVPLELRLRRLLKIAGRQLRLRCVDIRPANGPGEAGEAANAGGMTSGTAEAAQRATGDGGRKNGVGSFGGSRQRGKALGGIRSSLWS